MDYRGFTFQRDTHSTRGPHGGRRVVWVVTDPMLLVCAEDPYERLLWTILGSEVHRTSPVPPSHEAAGLREATAWVDARLARLTP